MLSAKRGSTAGRISVQRVLDLGERAGELAADACTVAMIATEMPAAIRPYSIAVELDSSRAEHAPSFNNSV